MQTTALEKDDEKRFCLPEERQHAILQKLADDGRVVALELSRDFKISEDTIRRDLRELAAAGLCRRVYGGALPVSPASRSLDERRTYHPLRKQKLGEKMCTLLCAGQVVFVDAGSTNLAAMQALGDDLALTVVTNSPAIGVAVVNRSRIKLLMIGGQIDPRTGASFGARALRDLSFVRPDVYLLGACAVDAEAGVSAFDGEEAEFKRTLAEQACCVLSAATNDKLATRAPFLALPTKGLSDLVLEADAPPSVIASLRELGVRVHLAATQGPILDGGRS